jgi:hypothetical protein
MQIDKSYKTWLEKLKHKISVSQLKVAVSKYPVNGIILGFS